MTMPTKGMTGYIGQSRLIQLVTLVLCAVVAKLAATALSPVQEPMRLAFGLNDNDMALLQGPALALSMVVLAIPLGILIDHSSRVRLMLILLLTIAAGSIMTAMAESFTMLFLGRCLVGFASSTVVIIGFSLLADWYLPERRGRMKAMLVVGQYGGASLAFAIGGQVMALVDGAQDWRWAIFWITIPALAVAVCLLLPMQEPARTGVAVRQRPSLAAFRKLWAYRAIVGPLTLGIILAEVPIFAVLSWAAPAFTRTYALQPAQVGAILGTALLLGGVLGPIVGGTLADMCQRVGGPRRTMSAIVLITILAAPIGVFPLMPGAGSAGIMIAIFFLLIAAVVNMSATLFTIVVPNDLRGLSLSIMAGGVSLVGIMMAPLAVSLLSGVLGGPSSIGLSLAIVCIGGSIVAALAFELGRRLLPAFEPTGDPV